MSQLLKITSISSLIFLMASCSDNTVYDEYIAIDNANWKKENVATFEFEAKDTLTPHNIYINIRNKGDYAYSNLYLFVTINGPSGDFSKDTVNCVIADNRGKWKGKGIGDLWDYQQPYLGNVKFAKKGIYTVYLEQAMRVEDGLNGISDIGLKIEKITTDK